MYVYIQSEKGGYYGDEYLPPLYTVGHYEPATGKFIPESDHTTEDAAVKRVHYLNGGNEAKP